MFGALHAEHDWHLGTAGVVDEGFYSLLRDYLRRSHAPRQAVQAVEFVHDLGAWDLTSAAQGADSLIAWARAGVDWVPAELLLDGAFTAKLQSGNAEGARHAFESLLPRARRSTSDLRTRLMAAHLDSPTREGARQP